MNSSFLTRLRGRGPLWRRPLTWAMAAVALLLVAAGLTFWLTRPGADDEGPLRVAEAGPQVVEAGPEGDEIARMAPITIAFAGSVDPASIERSLSLSPAVDGDIAWKARGEEKLLLFQPQWPGYARGTSYSVSIGAGDPQRGELGQPLAFSFTTEGKLEVQMAIPGPDSLEVATDTEVLVQFNRPVATLTVLQEPAAGLPLRFDPPLAGEGKWLTSTIYIFRPAEGLAPATRYQATVPSTVSDTLGGSLAADYVWSFTTVSPAVAERFPTDGSLFVGPATEVKVTFNQPVARASAEARFALLEPDGATVPGSFAWPDDLTLLFQPSQPLLLSTRYEAHLESGILALGRTDVATAADSRWSFVTVGLPTVQSTNPSQGARAAREFGAVIQFNNPMDPESVEAAITISPQPEEGTLRFFWEPAFAEKTFEPRGPQPGDRILHLNFPTKPSSPYAITIGPGATDRYGQPLQGAPFLLTYITAPATPSFFLHRTGTAGVFNAYGQPQVRISSVNVSRLDFELFALDMQTFIKQEANPDNIRRLTERLAPLLRRWSLTIPNPPLNETVVNDVDLEGPDGASLAPGFYALRVASPQADRDYLDGTLIVVTRTHMALKRSQNDLLVWAVDMASGQPLANLPIAVYDDSGQRRADGSIDADGVFVAQMPRPEEWWNERLYVTAQRPGDASLASSRWTFGFEPWEFEIPSDFSPRSYVGYLYTDRPIYRPGQSVYYKTILRADDDARYSLPAPADSFVVAVTDARGRLVEQRTVQPSDMGTFDGRLDLSSEATTGFYQIMVWEETAAPQFGPEGRMDFLKGSGPPVAWLSFQVAEFRKPEFQVDVAAAQPEYVQGQEIAAELEARYFFGQPVADADVRWQVTARPYFFRWPEGPHYSFTDFDFIYGQEQPPQFRLRREEVGQSDTQGRLALSLPADVSTDPLSQVFVIEATVTDANQQQVSGNVEAVVHKGAFYIGLKPRRYVARAGDSATVDVVTLDPQQQPVGNVPMTIAVYQRRWLSVRERDPDGFFFWRSLPEDTLVETLQVSTDAGGSGSLTFTPARGGTYRLVAEANDAAGNPIRSAAYLWVTSSEFISWRMTNDNRLEMRPDRNQYAPGDTARILVTAPFEEGLGLVTVERGRIISRQVLPFPTNSTVVEVPITSDHIPNIYISVALFKGTSDANPVPAFRLGYAALQVATDAKVINVAIKPDQEQLEPRQNVTYAITTTDAQGRPLPAELSLALVDMAVLTLADESAPKPLQAFWRERPLGVQTAADYALSIDRLLQITPRPPATGGKGGGGGIPTEDVRRLFPDTAYWEPALRTDAQGQASVTVSLPDTLTTWRLTAKAVSLATQVGDTTSDIVTSKALILRPVTPRFLVVNDTVRLEAIVHNFTDASQQAQVSLQAQGLTIADASPQSVTIPPGEFRQVAWQTSVSPGGSALLTFAAQAGALSDAVELALPIYTYGTPEVVATAGQVTTDPVTEVVQLPGWVQRDRGDLTLELSPSLAAAMNFSLHQIDEYPYENVGITVSRLLPRLALHRAINQLGLPDTLGLEAKLPSLVARSLQRLYNCQLFDGGWSWQCLPPAGSNPEITAYALLGLAQARQEGFAVDADVIARAADFLRNWLGLGRDVERPLDPNTRAFILYVLAAADQGDLGLTNALAQERQSLGNYGKAFLALALLALTDDPDNLHLQALLSDLTTAALLTSTGSHWQDDPGDRSTLNTSTRSTAIVLLALARAASDHPLVESTVRWLMVARRQGHWATTQETAWSLLALTEYMAATGELKGDYSYQVRLNDQQRLEKKVDASTLTQSERLVLQVQELLLDEENQLAIARAPGDAPGRLYYTLHLRYFPPGEEVEAASHGVGVGREYLPAGGGASVTGASLGDLVQVRLTVVAPTDLHYAVVEDFLPAGLEPVDTTLKTTSHEMQRLLAQAQQALQPQGPRRWFYFNPFEHVEMRDNRVVLFATFLPKGVHQYVYLARATTAGQFRVMPARAYESFFPEVWGRTDGAIFAVNP
ncbi:MAG: Ig-like domain-containing protein [Dehalococcoidia bacterium]